jgi:hypothetical protein
MPLDWEHNLGILVAKEQVKERIERDADSWAKALLS